MAKKVTKEEFIETVDTDSLDLTEEVRVPVAKESNEVETIEDSEIYPPTNRMVSCLRNERIIVRFIPRESGMVTNPKHVFYGGMAENSIRVFTVPILESNGKYVNVLTNEEKLFLEEFMGLPFNALSIYRKENNYWDNFYVRLTKVETILDLSNPNDYIKYKVLLANKDFIAGSLQELQDTPKATYQYVLISEVDETRQSTLKLNATMEAYKEFGRIESDVDAMRVIIETIDGKPTSPSTKVEFLQAQINRIIQSDSKLFLKVVTDPYLPTKVLIKKGLEQGLITKRGNYLYLREDNTPLCEANEEPTLNIAAKFLNSPKRQAIKFALEAKINS